MTYPAIRLAAYTPDSIRSAWIETIHTLRFGASWHEALMRMYRLGYPDAWQLPVRSLNTLARAVAPGVVATGRRTGATATSAPWLYARHEISPDVIRPLLFAWAHTLAPKEGGERALDDAIRDIAANPPEWSAEPLDLLESRPSDGGTAMVDGRVYELLPEWLAARLAERPCRLPGGVLKFRVVSSEGGAELVSWPPQKYPAQGRTWYYSVCMRLTVQTAPFRPAFQVHASAHLRRWSTVPGVRPVRGRAAVLLDVPVPWPDLESERARLIPACMVSGPRHHGLAWDHTDPAGILDELDLVRAYPDARAVAAEPEAYLLGRQDIAAGVVHSEGMRPHEVGKGLTPGERAELDAWVEEGLAPYFRRVPDLVKATTTNKPTLLPRLTDTRKRADPERYTADLRDRISARHAALRAALGGRPLEIEIHWAHERTRDQLITDLCELLGFRPEKAVLTGLDQSWRVGRLDVHIHSAPLGELGAPLNVATGKRSDAVANAARERHAEVVARLGAHPAGDDLSVLKLAFVEIGDPDQFPSPATDPKQALRHGFATAGRLTQFIVDADDAQAPLPIRSHSACLDGFRQLGAVTIPRFRGSPGMPDDLQHIGLWMVRHNATGSGRRRARRLVAIRVRPGDEKHPVCGWDEERCAWIPYPRFLLTVGQETEPTTGGPGSGDFVDERSAHDVQRQIKTLLNEVRDRPTLLLVNAANLRGAWPFLTNIRLVAGALQFDPDRSQRLAVYGTNLRIVRVRDRNGRDETPTWYGTDGTRVGFAAGLWQPGDAKSDNNQVFYSTADAAPAASTLPRSAHKIFRDSPRSQAPAELAWNPQCLELTFIGGHPDDRPVDWAAHVHQSRYHDDYFPLSRPFAQHLAKHVSEYTGLAPHSSA